MSLRTRITALERALARNDPPETVVRVRIIAVHNREEAEALRTAGLLDPARDNGRSVPLGPVRVEVGEVVDAADVLAEFSKSPTCKAGD
jgi:hypothetical protein